MKIIITKTTTMKRTTKKIKTAKTTPAKKKWGEVVAIFAHLKRLSCPPYVGFLQSNLLKSAPQGADTKGSFTKCILFSNLIPNHFL